MIDNSHESSRISDRHPDIPVLVRFVDGDIEVGISQNLGFLGYSTPLESLHRLRALFPDVEFSYRLLLSGSRITKAYLITPSRRLTKREKDIIMSSSAA